jgi:hypothetical protein
VSGIRRFDERGHAAGSDAQYHSFSIGDHLNLSQGQSATVTTTIARNNGYAGSVDLSLEGAPTGVAGAFSPATVPSGAATSSLALTVSSNVPAGSYPLTVRGRGQGVADNTAALTLAVTPAGDFSLTVTPAIVYCRKARL